jgi:predicted O-methyltransferase YrrM
MSRRFQADVAAPPSKDNAVAAAQAVLRAALPAASGVDLSWIQPPPSHNGWALAPDALRFLVSLIAHLRPRHILEFGSGLSTRVMARACAEIRSPCGITSVDHDPEFGRTAAQEIVDQKVHCRVRFQLAPLVARDCGGRMLPVYLLRPRYFASQRPPDLVVIDGPPVVLGGREGILYQALDFARPGTIVVLDDAEREEEQVALSRWQDNLGQAIEVSLLHGFTKGMAVIIVREPIPRADLWTYQLRLTAQDLAALIPPGDAFILVDQDWWGRQVAVGRHSIPFLERDGQYWGPPADDITAIREVERLKQSGARFMVFGWPAFWWLNYYSGLREYLRSRFRCILENNRLVVFDLRSNLVEAKLSHRSRIRTSQQ